MSLFLYGGDGSFSCQSKSFKLKFIIKGNEKIKLDIMEKITPIDET